MGQIAQTPDSLLSFWLDEIGPKGWYVPGEGVDEQIRSRFLNLWNRVTGGDSMCWTSTPRSMLALIILLDQFPRNMFRASGTAFSSDNKARACAKSAIKKGWDLRIKGEARQFIYMPLSHSECLEDQDRAVRLFKERMPESKDSLLHARAHREVIRRFGRFPHRNAELGRNSTPQEKAFLAEGGYGSVVDSLKAAS